MDEERTDLLGESSIITAKWRWAKLSPLSGDALELQYRHTLKALAKEKGLIGTIFRQALNNLADPPKLERGLRANCMYQHAALSGGFRKAA